jgi:uncharacterized protein with ParB-like and HNH nuclease domain
MPQEAPLTVRAAIESIERKRLLLPAIQREFVWDYSQIELLFDSLLQGYPLGSLLLWRFQVDPKSQYEIFEFLRDYHARDAHHNPPANVTEKEVTLVLDGQQRLTALNIGLLGSFTARWAYSRWAKDSSFSKMRLYLNLSAPLKDDESRKRFEFKFLDDAEVKSEDGHWFPVGNILRYAFPDVTKYLHEHNLLDNGFAHEALGNLYDAINSRPVLPYFLETSSDEMKALDMFLRANNTGEPLAYSDLLMSIATANSPESRKEITSLVDELNKIGDGFRVDKEFVLKVALALTESEIAFRVSNFKKENVDKIKDSWKEISASLTATLKLADSLGYRRENLPSVNALIPVAYFVYTRGVASTILASPKQRENRDLVRIWLAKASLKRIFGGQTDTLLRSLREKIRGSEVIFPREKIEMELSGTSKSLQFTADDLDRIMKYDYGEKYTFSVLALLFPGFDFRTSCEVDHLHPKSSLTKPALKRAGVPSELWDDIQLHGNRIGNLQLLEGRPNSEKLDTPLGEWLDRSFPKDEERRAYMRANLIPDVDMGLRNLLPFVKAREALMKKELARLVEMR